MPRCKCCLQKQDGANKIYQVCDCGFPPAGWCRNVLFSMHDIHHVSRWREGVVLFKFIHNLNMLHSVHTLNHLRHFVTPPPAEDLN